MRIFYQNLNQQGHITKYCKYGILCKRCCEYGQIKRECHVYKEGTAMMEYVDYFHEILEDIKLGIESKGRHKTS